MRTRTIVTFFFALFLACCGAVAAGDEWLKSIDDGLKQAKATDRLVLVDFTAAWCGWCKKLQTDVFDREEFQKFASEHLVLVSIDADAHRDLVGKYKVEGFPTIVFLNADGEKVHEIVGYLPLDGFMAQLEGMLKGGQKK